MNGRTLTLGLVAGLAVAGLARKSSASLNLRGARNGEALRSDLLPDALRDTHDLVVTEIQKRTSHWEPTGVGNGVTSVPYRYHTLVASLNFLVSVTRDDMRYSQGKAAKFCQNPGDVHIQNLQHLLRFLKGSIEYGVNFVISAGPMRSPLDSVHGNVGSVQPATTSGFCSRNPPPTFGRQLARRSPRSRFRLVIGTSASEEMVTLMASLQL